jgi:hypothetical protein
MPQYQLVVHREYYKNQQKTYALDLDGDTIEEARAHAKLLLYGDPSKWQGKLVSSSSFMSSGPPDLEVQLDPEGEIDPHYGFLMGVGNSRIKITSATLVEVTGEELDIPGMQKELDTWAFEEKQRLLADPEYQELLRLKKKFAS